MADMWPRNPAVEFSSEARRAGGFKPAGVLATLPDVVENPGFLNDPQLLRHRRGLTCGRRADQ
jgi:hypothetical protein